MITHRLHKWLSYAFNYIVSLSNRRWLHMYQSRLYSPAGQLIYDDPETDNTDFAHPAWFRGSVWGLDKCLDIVRKIIAGQDEGRGIMQEKADELRQTVLGLKRERDELRLTVARLEVEAVDRERR